MEEKNEMLELMKKIVREQQRLWVREKVDIAYAQSAFPAPFGKPEIVTCKYRNDANLIGALRFHLEYTK